MLRKIEGHHAGTLDTTCTVLSNIINLNLILVIIMFTMASMQCSSSFFLLIPFFNPLII